MTDTTATTPGLDRRLRRKRIVSAMLLSLIVFVSGAAVGWGIAVLMGPRPPRPGEGGLMRDPPVPAMVARLRKELLLSEEQSKQVEDIYKARFDALKAIRDDMAPRMKKEYDGLREQMKAVLNPEQFARWEERFNNVRNRMLPPREGERGGRGMDGLPGGQRPRGEGGVGGPPEGPMDGPGGRMPPPPFGGFREGMPPPPRDGMPPRPRNGPPASRPAGSQPATDAG